MADGIQKLKETHVSTCGYQKAATRGVRVRWGGGLLADPITPAMTCKTGWNPHQLAFSSTFKMQNFTAVMCVCIFFNKVFLSFKR